MTPPNRPRTMRPPPQGDVVVAHPDAPLAEAAALLDGAAGLPVVDRLGSHKVRCGCWQHA